jgi:site-specific recombinase XerD
MNQFLIDFHRYLEYKKMSYTSIKNYISDVRQFLDWSAKNGFNLSASTAYLSYRLHLIAARKPSQTINRRLASLRAFGKFLKQQRLLVINPAEALINISNYCKSSAENISAEKKLLHKFRKSLVREKLSLTTVKNYLSDVEQFLKFVKKGHS